MIKKAKVIFSKAEEVIFRYPMVLTVSLIATICANVLHGRLSDRFDNFAIVKLLILSLLGISLFFAAKMAAQRYGKWWLFESIGLLIIAILFFILPDNEKDFSEIYGYLLVVVFVLTHLLVSFSAFLTLVQEKKFWNYNKNLFLNIFNTVVFTAVLVGGVELAILAVANLFDFRIHEDTYFRVFAILGIFGSTFIFLLFNERGLRDLEREDEYPVILKFFTQFILIPLLLIYVIILYLYAAKILINWELPRGWVSYLILAYSIVGIFALLLVNPLKGDISRSWVIIFSKIFYFTLVPLLLLLFTAIFTRILEYGYTEPRYFVLLLALWLSSVVLYNITFHRLRIKFIPLSLFCFGLFAIVFPYLNAFSVAKTSQKNQLEALLIQNKLLQNGEINFNKKISAKTAGEIADKFSYLTFRNEEKFLNNFIAEKEIPELAVALQRKEGHFVESLVQDAFINTHISSPKAAAVNYRFIPLSNVQNVTGYDFIVDWYDLRDGVIVNDDEFKILNELNTENPKFSIILNDKSELSFLKYVQDVVKREQSAGYENKLDKLETEGNVGDYHIKIYFKSINVSHDYKDKQKIYVDNALVLIKLIE